KDHTESFWRRLVLIPFERKFSGTAGDRKDLHEVLLQKEGPGILAWAVRGCLAWQRDGLRLPPSVIEARRAYREDTDVFGDWFAECCERELSRRCRLHDALVSYTA